MSDELAREILSRLDISADTLGGWGTQALEQYCQVQAMYNTVLAIVLGVLTVIVLAISARCVIKCITDEESDWFESRLLVAAFGSFLSFVFLILFVTVLIPAIQWAQYPDGMIMQILLRG